MRSKVLLGMVVIMAMMLMLATGCAKKTTSSSEGQGLSFTTPAPGSVSGASDAEMQAMKMAEQELTANKIFFDFDKYDLKPASKDVLKAKAAVLKKYGSWKMLVEGHCDDRGTEEYNLALGERRARAAYEFLIVLGVPSSRLKIVSFGEERPAVSGSNETAWAKNRRAEFKVFK
ncbi:peptidoglycan-associated lipoprotein Pal [Desulfovibrio ferrophilus]|uniref:Peptidoglycan-associated lipoprotein n=1 Tax=Desulfovibrio ferrophilus TaxID=241368 RepID=A0A2Z6AYJ6_9BACT|nr:peptidoglycan-associated lipoprotein Pal [Desulfovibrio ferrophilus]BBD08334.1 peptidoglycan-associated lipoprotein [Desulfovibrio ferrophilus]